MCVYIITHWRKTDIHTTTQPQKENKTNHDPHVPIIFNPDEALFLLLKCITQFGVFTSISLPDLASPLSTEEG